MTYHAHRNAERYQLAPLERRQHYLTCAAGSRCNEPARFVATSPSFPLGKQMCRRHAEAWAERHQLEWPLPAGVKEWPA